MNHLHRFTLLHRPDSLAELCWKEVARLFRAFYPADLTSSRLVEVLRAASVPLLGLSSGVDNSALNPNDNRERNIFTYTKSVFSYLLRQLGCELYLLILYLCLIRDSPYLSYVAKSDSQSAY